MKFFASQDSILFLSFLICLSKRSSIFFSASRVMDTVPTSFNNMFNPCSMLNYGLGCPCGMSGPICGVPLYGILLPCCGYLLAVVLLWCSFLYLSILHMACKYIRVWVIWVYKLPLCLYTKIEKPVIIYASLLSLLWKHPSRLKNHDPHHATTGGRGSNKSS